MPQIPTKPFIFIFCSFLVLLEASNDNFTCPANCRCQGTPGEIKCSNITDIPEKIPPENTSILDLSANNISQIPIGSFSYLTNLLSLNLRKNSIKVLYNNSFLGMARLKKLDLSSNVIATIVRGSFKDLRNLETLDLSHNRIAFLDGIWLQDLVSLQELDVSFNKIYIIKPGAFAGLNNLISLNLRNNELGKLELVAPDESQPLPLHMLYLSQNNFTKIPSSAFKNMQHLQTLVLSHLPYLDKVEKDAFAGLVHLKQLHLSNNKRLVSIDRHAFSIVPRLKFVYFENNSIETFHSDLLPWTRLQIVDLRFNKLQCNCSLRWMSNSKQLTTTKATTGYANQLNCSGPSRLASRSVLSLSASDFGCSTKGDNAGDIVQAFVVAAVAVGALLTCALLIKYRHIIRSAFIPKYKRQFDDSTNTIDIDEWAVGNESETFIPTETVDELKL